VTQRKWCGNFGGNFVGWVEVMRPNKYADVGFRTSTQPTFLGLPRHYK
jgi:hypothetical protein